MCDILIQITKLYKHDDIKTCKLTVTQSRSKSSYCDQPFWRDLKADFSFEGDFQSQEIMIIFHRSDLRPFLISNKT